MNNFFFKQIKRTLINSKKKDLIIINDLVNNILINNDICLNGIKKKKISINLAIKKNIEKASFHDNLEYSIDYGLISKHIDNFLQKPNNYDFKNLDNLGNEIIHKLQELKIKKEEIDLILRIKNDNYHTGNIEYLISNSDSSTLKTLKINDIFVNTIIGILSHERINKQKIKISLSLDIKENLDINILDLLENVKRFAQNSQFYLVEAFSFRLGEHILKTYQKTFKNSKVKVFKYNLFNFVKDGIGVEFNLKNNFKDNLLIKPEKSVKTGSLIRKESESIAFIGIGCNNGNYVENFNKVFIFFKKYGLKVLCTSSMVLSKPMYKKNQKDFCNAVVKISILDKSPFELLKILKIIEYKHLGRICLGENEPRTMDLDILLYDDIVLNTEKLKIPHISMSERIFVLGPLCELLPPDSIHPVSKQTYHSLLSNLLKTGVDKNKQESLDLTRINPLQRLSSQNIFPLKFNQDFYKNKTLIMGVVNITPNSFSDKIRLIDMTMEKKLTFILDMINNGALIIDLGGSSSKPNSTLCSEEEELERILPIVKTLRNSENPKLSNCIISIDTTRHKVAEKCLIAGADIINDVSMGTFDNKMFDIIAKYHCPYIMNHIRGNQKTMNKLTTYHKSEKLCFNDYNVIYSENHAEDIFLKTVSQELILQIKKAFEKGIKKWQIILDPGLGFAKTVNQNISLIKNLNIFKTYCTSLNDNSEEFYFSFNGLSTLIGPSRKSFLNKIVSEPNPSKRLSESIVASLVSYQKNVDVVRVHDVKETKKSLTVADFFYKFNFYN